MAKSIRSKIKKKHRSYMRATIGEKVRSAQIEAAAKRGAMKRAGRANTKTLKYMRGALGAGQVDLGKAYYDAIVRPAREGCEAAPDAAAAAAADDVEEDSSDEEDEDDDVDMAGEEAAPAPTPVATLEEEAACQLSLRTKEEKLTAKVKLNRGGNGKKVREGGSGIFSKRSRRRADVASGRPAKEMVSF